MKRILILSGGYLPGENYGGPVVSLSNMVDNLSDEFEFYILTKNHDLNTSKPYENVEEGWNQVGAAKVKYFPDSKVNLSNIEEVFKDVNPEIIYQNSFFSYKFFSVSLILSLKYKTKLLIAPRGELLNNALKRSRFKKNIYIKVVKPFLRGSRNIYFQATSPDEEKAIISKLKIKHKNILLLKNMPITTTLNDQKSDKQKNTGELKLIYIGRIHPVKNLLFALKAIESLEGKVMYEIYGNIEDEKYWTECKKVISNLPKNITVIYKKTYSRASLEQVFANTHLLFLPTLTENYGHAIVESMNYKCPVLISDNTPWTTINDTLAGYALPLNKLSLFKKTLQELVEMDQKNYDLLVKNTEKYAENNFEILDVKEKYLYSLSSMWN